MCFIERHRPCYGDQAHGELPTMQVEHGGTGCDFRFASPTRPTSDVLHGQHEDVQASAALHSDAEFRVQEQGRQFSSHLQRSLCVTCSTARAMATKHMVSFRRCKLNMEEQCGIFGSQQQRGVRATLSLKHITETT